MVRAKHSILVALLWVTWTPAAMTQGVTEASTTETEWSSPPAAPPAQDFFPAAQTAPLCPPDLGCPIARGVEPRWVATAEALFLQRSATSGQPLLYDPGAAATLLDASHLDFAMSPGERLSLRWEDPASLGLEVSFFGIDSWRSSADFPSSAFLYGLGYLSIDDSMTVPVSEAQFQYSSRLYSGEVNLRYAMCDRITPLVGFRWIEFEDQYAASGQAVSGAFTELVRGHNHLYGAQIGLDARLFGRESPFQIGVVAKAGLYGNAAAASNTYADSTYDFAANASGSHLSFLGEVGISASYQFAKHFALRGGYQVMWLTGIALAPEQIVATDFGAGHLSVNASGALFCQGANAGLEATW